jgi:ABC-type molybdenum transport system ATPase subunit/photorepair protein PhrA
MSSRYAASTTLRNSNGKQRQSTVIVPNMPASVNDVYIQTTSTERLDKLALNFYQDATMWWIIAAANGLGKGTLIVPQNTIIRIPNNQNIQQVINQVNRSR